MFKILKTQFLTISLVILFITLKIVSTILPDEFAFCFCYAVFMQFTELWFRIYELSEQFRPIWPWQH